MFSGFSSTLDLSRDSTVNLNSCILLCLVYYFQSEIAFMPSVGVEFVTEIGAHLPDYVHSGMEVHTNIYHESGLRAKVALAHNQIKVTIPAPEGSSKLLSIT